jgi:hypothetical protein
MPATAPAIQAEPTSSTYITQHCANEVHEGVVKFGSKGDPFHACQGEYVFRFLVVRCTCDCHAVTYRLAEIQAEIDAEREAGLLPALNPPSNPTGNGGTAGIVATATSEPITPDAAGDAADARRRMYRVLLNTGNISAQPEALVMRHIFGKEYDPAQLLQAATGSRRTKGELELNIELLCHLWLDGKLVGWKTLTADAIPTLVDALDPPSEGAVRAVFTRWKQFAMAEIGEAPVRFIKFSDEVNRHGVEYVRIRLERERKRHEKGMF